MEEKLLSVELEFTTLDFYEKCVISRVREGVVISKNQVKIIKNECINFFPEKPFVYVSKRVNNYNVDPTIYYQLENASNLAGIAVVSTKPSSINMANFEQAFAKVPFSVFLEIEDAIAWIESLLPTGNNG